MNPKALNALAARVARLEKLLEDNDVFKPGGGTTYGGLDYQGSTYNFQGPQNLEQELAQNFGFDANAATIFELQQRIADLELMISNGSNDTYQGAALDAGVGVGDDASDGTGSAGGIPAGFTEVIIYGCVGGVSTQLTVLGRL